MSPRAKYALLSLTHMLVAFIFIFTGRVIVELIDIYINKLHKSAAMLLYTATNVIFIFGVIFIIAFALLSKKTVAWKISMYLLGIVIYINAENDIIWWSEKAKIMLVYKYYSYCIDSAAAIDNSNKFGICKSEVLQYSSGNITTDTIYDSSDAIMNPKHRTQEWKRVAKSSSINAPFGADAFIARHIYGHFYKVVFSSSGFPTPLKPGWVLYSNSDLE